MRGQLPQDESAKDWLVARSRNYGWVIRFSLNEKRVKLTQLFEPDLFWFNLVSPYDFVDFCIAMMGEDN